ncbi:FimV family protein [Undibacterium arcticum]
MLTVCGSAAHAVGVGTVSLQSALGQPLHASIPIIGNDNDVSTTCIKARVESSDGAFCRFSANRRDAQRARRDYRLDLASGRQ